MNQPNFWDDATQSNKLMGELKYLKSCVEPFSQSVKKVDDLRELADLSDDDDEMIAQIDVEVARGNGAHQRKFWWFETIKFQLATRLI